MSSRAYAPRRRVGPSRIRWDRVGRIALVLVLFGVMVSYLNPLVNLLEAWQGSKSSESQLAQLKQERVDLTGQLRAASSPATLERESRQCPDQEGAEHPDQPDEGSGGGGRVLEQPKAPLRSISGRSAQWPRSPPCAFWPACCRGL